ncbi:hypothetical protein SAMN05444145_105262 [Alistipes timonensis JC136]|uniref:Uncharacterized protein n=1 Tax=Alistipes timonensis JC136 TaxID=1033731 RepID=A0A1H4DF27_9BACT|nr:hypothetical protein [Alistipes timonensis]SEA71334.1 hypothetical protein SAMN05444145_105262 [Alistipes timonensis JC136]
MNKKRKKNVRLACRRTKKEGEPESRPSLPSVIILVRVFESLQFTLFPRVNEHREHDTCGDDTKEDKNKSNGNSFHKHKKLGEAKHFD